MRNSTAAASHHHADTTVVEVPSVGKPGDHCCLQLLPVCQALEPQEPTDETLLGGLPPTAESSEEREHLSVYQWLLLQLTLRPALSAAQSAVDSPTRFCLEDPEMDHVRRLEKMRTFQRADYSFVGMQECGCFSMASLSRASALSEVL